MEHNNSIIYVHDYGLKFDFDEQITSATNALTNQLLLLHIEEDDWKRKIVKRSRRREEIEN